MAVLVEIYRIHTSTADVI